MIRQKREKGDRHVDLRPLVKYMEAPNAGELRMGIRVLDGPGAKPQEVIQGVFGLKDDEVRSIMIVRVNARFKQARPVRHSRRGERARKAKHGLR